MKVAEDLKEELSRFHGGGNIYNNPIHLGRLTYTEGIRHLAIAAGAWWLTDRVASHQDEIPEGVYLQCWRLKVENQSAILTCHFDDEKEPGISEELSTDFPIEAIELWVIAKIMMLPSEY